MGECGYGRSDGLVFGGGEPRGPKGLSNAKKSAWRRFLLVGNGWVGLLSLESAGLPQLERISAEGGEEIPARGSDVERWAVGEAETGVHKAG